MGGDPFFNQIKKCWLHPGAIPVAWYVSSYSSSKSVLQQTLSSLCSIQDRTHGYCGFLLLLDGEGDADAGWAGAGLCCFLCVEITTYKIKFNSIKIKEPSNDLSVALDVFLSSLKCEINITSLGGGLNSVIWISILDPDSGYRPSKKDLYL